MTTRLRAAEAAVFSAAAALNRCSIRPQAPPLDGIAVLQSIGRTDIRYSSFRTKPLNTVSSKSIFQHRLCSVANDCSLTSYWSFNRPKI
jgi:hypothetical protein